MRTLDRKSTKPNETKPDPLMTEGKFRELEEDLNRLKKKRPKAAADVARLAELGDFSENVEYQLAKGRLRGINHRILVLEHQLNHAVMIESASNTHTVQIGHTVTIETNGKQKTYHILGSSETNPEKGIISHTSPLGSALLGHSVGDTVTVQTKEKETVYTIVSIE